jgi:hypothetical protein
MLALAVLLNPRFSLGRFERIAIKRLPQVSKNNTALAQAKTSLQ